MILLGVNYNPNQNLKSSNFQNHENWKIERCIDNGLNSLNRMEKKLQLSKGIRKRWYYGINSLK